VWTYLARRLLGAVPLLLAISLICFGLMHAAPGGPLARLAENPRITAEDLARLKHQMGLDRPLPVQYGMWLGRTLTGDLGRSFVTGENVATMILGRLPATLELMLTAFGLALGVGLTFGIVSALRRAKGLDYLTTFLAFIGISLPVFWLGLMFQMAFGVWLGWLPVSGRFTVGADETWADYLAHLVMPCLVLSLLYMASWSRYMRGSLIEVMSLDYIRTARAKGLAPRDVVMRHGVRNALIPVVTIVALQVPGLFTGAIITETVFSWPGMGRLFYDGISKGDYPRLMAIIVISSVLIVLFNLIADVLYAVLDPRIAYS
jgi:peptide/nickel transport system permease protein